MRQRPRSRRVTVEMQREKLEVIGLDDGRRFVLPQVVRTLVSSEMPRFNSCRLGPPLADGKEGHGEGSLGGSARCSLTDGWWMIQKTIGIEDWKHELRRN